MNSRMHYLIQVLGSLACFYWLFHLVSPGQLIEALQRSSWQHIALITLIMIPAILSRAWRWHYLLRRRGLAVPLGSITNATFIGMALNLFLPASAGDVVRSYYGWQRHGHKEEMLASTLADKVVALISLFLLGAVGGVVCGHTRLALTAAVLVVPATLVLVVQVRWPWNLLALLVRRAIRKELDVDLLLRSFHMDLATFFGAMAISVAGWLITNTMYFLAVSSVGAQIGVGFTFAIAPLINLLRMLPISISGLGSADALMVQLLGSVGIEKQLALAASMIVNLTLLILPGAIGAVLMAVSFRGQGRTAVLSQAPQDAEL